MLNKAVLGKWLQRFLKGISLWRRAIIDKLAKVKESWCSKERKEGRVYGMGI